MKTLKATRQRSKSFCCNRLPVIRRVKRFGGVTCGRHVKLFDVLQELLLTDSVHLLDFLFAFNALHNVMNHRIAFVDTFCERVTVL